MEAQYRTRSGRLTVRVEGKDHKELFRALAESQEIFDSESKCGCCQSESLRFTVRTREGNDYYKLVCEDCSATFDFGQTKQGARLYPKRRGKDEKPLPKGDGRNGDAIPTPVSRFSPGLRPNQSRRCF